MTQCDRLDELAVGHYHKSDELFAVEIMGLSFNIIIYQ